MIEGPESETRFLESLDTVLSAPKDAIPNPFTKPSQQFCLNRRLRRFRAPVAACGGHAAGLAISPTQRMHPPRSPTLKINRPILFNHFQPKRGSKT